MGKNNAQFIDANALRDMQAKNRNGMSIKKIAKEYGIGVVTAANAVKAKSMSEFKRLQAARSAKENANRKQRREAEKQNVKAKDQAAAKLRKKLSEPYTPEQTRALIDGLVEHVNNLEERLQTVVSLLIESDDNVVTRIYKLENKQSLLRRFLDKF